MGRATSWAALAAGIGVISTLASLVSDAKVPKLDLTCPASKARAGMWGLPAPATRLIRRLESGWFAGRTAGCPQSKRSLVRPRRAGRVGAHNRGGSVTRWGTQLHSLGMGYMTLGP